MFDFLKKFKKECVSTSEQLENTEEEIEEPVKQEKPIIAIIDGLLSNPWQNTPTSKRSESGG